jgi:alanine racemase
MVDRQAWAEIDLRAISRNIKAIRAGMNPRVEFCAVVKADGYGHGSIPVARAALAGGANRLAVAFVDEGVELRKAGFTCPILVMGYAGAQEAAKAISYDLQLALVSCEHAELVSGVAQRLGETALVHLKIDTGMHRLGLGWDQISAQVNRLVALPSLDFEGVFSHFADADSPDQSFARLQLSRFLEAVEALALQGLHPRIRHMANSAASLFLPEAHLDMVRVGIALYGMRASSDRPSSTRLVPALSVRARITQLRWIPQGDSVGYGRNWVADRDTRIAVLPLGYADGISRALSGRGRVCFQGQSAPMVGRICMDQLMVDVTDLPDLSVGGEAVLAGYDGPPIAEIADLLGTIDYEVVCAIRSRVPRLYIERNTEMSEIEFRKYHSLGNDYLVVDPRSLPVPPSEHAIKAICDRTSGIGSDGVLIGPLRDGSGLDLRIYNPDGSEAEKSGNGLMIYAWFLYEQGMAGPGLFPLMTEGGGVHASIEDAAARIVRVDMGQASFDARSMGLRSDEAELVGKDMSFEGRSYQVTCVSVGNPHCAIMMNKVNPGHARFLGPILENHELFPHRVNAVFVELIDETALRIEIWERGAGYTMASGTSACAAAAAARRLGLVGDIVTVNMPGGAIDIRFDGDRVLMTGTVEPLFYGRFSEALKLRLHSDEPEAKLP